MADTSTTAEGGNRYTVPASDHRRRIQAIGAAISRRDWSAVELAHAEVRDAFDRPDIYDPAALAAPSPASGGVTAEPVAWAYEYNIPNGEGVWELRVTFDKPRDGHWLRNIRPLGFIDAHPPVAAEPGAVVQDRSGLAQSHYELLRECQAEFRALGCKGLVETIERQCQRHLEPLAAAPTPPAAEPGAGRGGDAGPHRHDGGGASSHRPVVGSLSAHRVPRA